MASQYNEDAIIAAYFGESLGTGGARYPGRFIEVGAHDGVVNSNTHALAERGWGGVCVEPSPLVFPHLMETYAGREDVVCINAAIGAETRIVRFHDANGDQLGTTDEAHRARWEAKGHPFAAMYLQTLTWPALLETFPGPYRFVSIDVEGTNLAVLEAAPLAEIGCDLVCVEREQDGRMRELLRSKGFNRIQETPGNFLASL